MHRIRTCSRLITVGGAALAAALLLSGCRGTTGAEPASDAAAPVRPDVLTLETSPVDLPAGSDHHAVIQPASVRMALAAGGWLRGFEVEVVDGRGEPVPHAVLHHLKLLDPQRRDLFHPYMLRVLGAGAETGAARLPWPFRYPLAAGDTVILGAMLHNPGDVAFTDVRVRLRLSLGHAGPHSRVGLYPFYLSVTDAGESSSYDLPPGRSTRSWEGSPVVTGRILGLGGHLHRYGTELVFEDVTRGKVLWRGVATRDENGEVLDVTRTYFHWQAGLPLRADRVYRLTGVYENPTGATIPDAGMAMLGGVLLPATGTEWPASEPDHPIYVADLMQEMGLGPVSGHETRQHGHHHP